MSATRYLVLRRMDENVNGGAKCGQWIEVGTFEASSAESALRQFGGTAGTYVATPARSWKPVVLEVETVQRTKISAASSAEPKASA